MPTLGRSVTGRVRSPTGRGGQTPKRAVAITGPPRGRIPLGQCRHLLRRVSSNRRSTPRSHRLNRRSWQARTAKWQLRVWPDRSAIRPTAPVRGSARIRQRGGPAPGWQRWRLFFIEPGCILMQSFRSFTCGMIEIQVQPYRTSRS